MELIPVWQRNSPCCSLPSAAAGRRWWRSLLDRPQNSARSRKSGGKEDNIMKLNCKRIDFTYTPGEEIFAFPKKSGLPFLFDVEEELTADPAAMDAVGEMLDEAV